ncbi:hypothetical protein GQ53DRAFT_817012 [Thozetella sp. PMI_491]|nr:hypothetical protein GQ53DRAFT_817012 [Thozetella sp. PMI_491]
MLYEAPESQVPVNGRRVLGRQYDVWSLGCVILELLIWLLYGYDEVLRFYGNPKAVVYEGVLMWVDHMARYPAYAKDTALGEVLGFVKNKLLVVDLGLSTSSMLVMKDIPSVLVSGLDTPEIPAIPPISGSVCDD